MDGFLTLLFSHGPHHEVHTGGVGLAAQFERAQLTLEVLDVVQDPLQLRLAAAELLQHEVMNLLHKVCLKVWRTQEVHWYCYSHILGEKFHLNLKKVDYLPFKLYSVSLSILKMATYRGSLKVL